MHMTWRQKLFVVQGYVWVCEVPIWVSSNDSEDVGTSAADIYMTWDNNAAADVVTGHKQATSPK